MTLPGRFASVITDQGFGILPVVCVFQGSYFDVFTYLFVEMGSRCVALAELELDM